MKGRWFIFALVIAAAPFVLNSVATALTFDFVGADAQKWFDDFVGRATVGEGDAGWQLTKDGLTTDDNVETGHQRFGFAEDWTDYTVETKYKYLILGAHKEAHLYLRWTDEANNYYIRTIGRGAQGGAWSIEWLRKVDAANNEGDIGDDLAGELQADTTYGFRGTIVGQTVTVDFFMDGAWSPAGEVTFEGPHETGGIGVGRATAQVAWQYLRVNGEGIPADGDGTPVEALGKLATTWGRLKR